MTDNQLLERVVSDGIRRAVVAASACEHDVAAAEIGKIEEDVLAQLPDAEIRLEARRRFSELRLSTFASSPGAGEFFDRSWRQLEQLGFSSDEREASMLVFRIKNARKRGDSRAREEALRRLEHVVNTRIAGHDSRMADHFREVIRRNSEG
jgi:hypothetical protein